MNKFVLLLLGLALLPGVASAYQININAPETLSVGKPLVVSGTTNFGIGTPIDVVLYYQLTSNTEVKRKIAYVQSDRTFRVVFDTTNLKKGTYKVEVPASGLGDSVNTRVIELIDRTDEISLTHSLQTYTGTLRVTGSMQENRNAGVQIEVTGPDGERVFGPQYIATNNLGAFSTDIPITRGGEYEVSFTDNKGYVGTMSITVVSETATAAPAQTPEVTRLTAHAKASRDKPAYFELKTGTAPVTVTTSSQADWVMEYVDVQGVLRSINATHDFTAETVTIEGRGRTIYFKVYPYRSTESREVYLYAENARSLAASATVPAVFLERSDVSSGGTETPLVPELACLAILIALVFRLRPA